MKERLLTAAVGIPLALAIVIASAWFPWVMYTVLLLLCMIGIYEVLKTVGADRNKILYPPCFLYGVIVMLSPLLDCWGWDLEAVILPASLVFLFVMFAILLKKHQTLRIETLCAVMILTMFVSFPFMVMELIYMTFSALVLPASDDGARYFCGVAMVAYCLIVSWVADGGAYFVGRALGKHKMAPVLSPKKTVEGAVGGFVISLILSLGTAFVYADVLHCLPWKVNFLHLATISAVCILMSMFGDISFSAVKRQYGIKDFGNLMPGHGGVLDRFDSVLFVCPTFYLLQFILPILAITQS